MDFALPDDITMDIMKKEYDKLRLSASARIFARQTELDNRTPRSDDAPPPDYDKHGVDNDNLHNTPFAFNEHDFARLSNLFLFLYFACLLRYNKRYGTEIYDAHRGVGQLQSESSSFGELNNLGNHRG